MGRTGIDVQGLDRVTAKLLSTGVELNDLRGASEAISKDAAALVRARVPKRSGALARSVKAEATRNRASVSIGSAAVPYAAAINYGWPKRKILAANFIEAVDTDVRQMAERKIEKAIRQLLERKHLL